MEKQIAEDALAKICYDPSTIEETELEIMNNKYENLQKEFQKLNEEYKQSIEQVKQNNHQLEKINNDNKTLKEIIISFSKILEQ